MDKNLHHWNTSGILRIGILIIFTISLLVGCKPPEVTGTAVVPTATVQTRTPTLKATTTRTVTPTSTQPQCPEIKGTVERLSFESDLLQKPQYISVYFPPCYEPHPVSRYPVIYLLHAQTYADDQYQRLGAVAEADVLISSGERVPFIMVMPFEEDNDKYSGNNPYFQVLLGEIVPWVDDSFPTCTDKTCRVIDGISRGAAWAMKCGLASPEIFFRVAAHSLPGFNNAEQLVRDWLTGENLDDLPVIHMDAGKSDYFISETRKFDALLTSMGVSHMYIENEGNHDEKYWESNMKEYIIWDSDGWIPVPNR
jgi:enterochelin esterase-like enzyme